MANRKTGRTPTPLSQADLRAQLAILRAVSAVEDLDKRRQQALGRGDVDGLDAVAAVAQSVLDSTRWLFLADQIARGRNWSPLGELLAMLRDAHRAESADPRGGATGVAFIRRAASREETITQKEIALYDELATCEYQLMKAGRVVPHPRPLLEGLLHPIVTRTRGIGLESLRRNRTAYGHPVMVLISHLGSADGRPLPPGHQGLPSPASLAERLREYDKGVRVR